MKGLTLHWITLKTARYLDSRGVSLDLVPAAQYFTVAADQGHPLGQFWYANCLQKGRGVPVDNINYALWIRILIRF
jgi:TPR repeat protein